MSFHVWPPQPFNNNTPKGRTFCTFKITNPTITYNIINLVYYKYKYFLGIAILWACEQEHELVSVWTRAWTCEQVQEGIFQVYSFQVKWNYFDRFHDMSKYTLTNKFQHKLTCHHCHVDPPLGHSTTMSMLNQMWIQNPTKVCAPCVEAQKGFWHIS